MARALASHQSDPGSNSGGGGAHKLTWVYAPTVKPGTENRNQRVFVQNRVYSFTGRLISGINEEFLECSKSGIG